MSVTPTLTMKSLERDTEKDTLRETQTDRDSQSNRDVRNAESYVQ